MHGMLVVGASIQWIWGKLAFCFNESAEGCFMKEKITIPDGQQEIAAHFKSS